MESTMALTEGEKMVELDASEIEYVSYGGEHHLPLIMNLVDEELSEPYSIFTYRYFVYLWPQLSILAFHRGKCIGTVVCKMGDHRGTFRGYIAMLVVLKPYRGHGIDVGGKKDTFKMMSHMVTRWVEKEVMRSIAFLLIAHPLKLKSTYHVAATELVTRAIRVMMESGCEEVTLEAEVTNKGALALYGRLGFIRAKRLFRYYLNGVDAFRLKLLFPRTENLTENELHGLDYTNSLDESSFALDT